MAEYRKVYGLGAEFTSSADLLVAAEKVRDAGHTKWDVHTPFPVHGLDKAMAIKPTILPVLVFFGGMTGTMIALALQILTNSTNIDLSFAFLRGYQFPIGEWNYEEVWVKGSRIKVELNGTPILETDVSKIDPATFMAGHAHPGKDRTSGHFGFAGHNDPVMFRNVAIKKL